MAAYNLILAAAWAPFASTVRFADLLLAAHAAAAGLPVLLKRAPAIRRGPGGWLRESYPLLWLPALWVELDPLIALWHAGTADAWVRALDLAVFGVHLDRVWMPAMPHRWFSELMHLAYYAYYPLIFLPPIAVAAAGRTEAFRDMTLRLLATYTTCYLVYLTMPTLGPHELLPRFEGELSQGFFYRLVESAHASGNVRGAAFPSSHVAGAVTIALLGWRWLGRTAGVLMSLEGLGVMMSTVYTQNHYGIDVVAGIACVLLVQTILVPALRGDGADPRPWRSRAADSRNPPPQGLLPIAPPEASGPSRRRAA